VSWAAATSLEGGIQYFVLGADLDVTVNLLVPNFDGFLLDTVAVAIDGEEFVLLTFLTVNALILVHVIVLVVFALLGLPRLVIFLLSFKSHQKSTQLPLLDDVYIRLVSIQLLIAANNSC